MTTSNLAILWMIPTLSPHRWSSSYAGVSTLALGAPVQYPPPMPPAKCSWAASDKKEKRGERSCHPTRSSILSV
eukprot:3529974-Lingulodinium_polyedra.AAC.1